MEELEFSVRKEYYTNVTITEDDLGFLKRDASLEDLSKDEVIEIVEKKYGDRIENTWEIHWDVANLTS